MAQTVLSGSGGDVSVSDAGGSATEQVIQKALEIQKTGKEALHKQNYDVAVARIAEALELVVKAFGELNQESAPFYLEYGSALLQQIASRGDVIGEAIKAAEQAAREQAEFEESEEEEYEQENETEANANEEGEAASEERDENETDEQQSVTEGKAESEEENGRDEDELKQAVEDSSADLEIVWEILETARVIYSRDHSKDGKLGLARSLERLGDFRMENDDVTGAIDEYNKCLELLEQNVEKSDRRLAAVHHALGIALINEKNSEKAHDHFLATKLVFARRVASLLGKEVLDPSSKSSEQEDTIPEWHNLYKTVTEEMIAELADEPERGEKNANDLKEYVEILKELDEKIVDMVENMKEIAIAPEEHSMAAVSNMIQEVMAEAAAAAGLGESAVFEQSDDDAAASSSADQDKVPEVNNLGILVGQKRKTELDNEVGNSAKKQKEAS